MFSPKWQTLVAGTAAVALTLGVGSLSATASTVSASTPHPTSTATTHPSGSTVSRVATPRVPSAVADRPAAGTRNLLSAPHHGSPGPAARTPAGQRAAWAAAVAAGAAHPSTRQHLTAASPAVAATADSSLDELEVGGNVTNLAPAFDPGTHDYQVLDYDDTSVTVTPTATTAGATVVVRSAGAVDAQAGGVATVPVARGRNDITITVTSSDSSGSTVTRLTVWRLAAPTSRIVSITDATSTVFGGTYARVTLANGELPSNGQCYRSYTVGGRNSGGPETSTFHPATGLTTDAVYIPVPAARVAGTADLVLTNHCNFGDVQAATTAPNAVTYTTTLHVDSVDVPAAVTSGTPIVINGAGITEYSDVAFWMTNAAGVSAPLNSWDFTTNNATTVYADYANRGPAGEAWYGGSGPRTLHVGYCPPDTSYYRADLTTCTSVYARTVNWVAPVPAQLSFAPASGPTVGGTVIKLRGRFVVSGTDDTTVTVGGQAVPNFQVDYEATGDNEDSTFASYTQAQDIIEFPAPASAVTGPQPITVTNDTGTTTAAGSFTYSAQPTITALTPASVATSGGSVITVTGTAFGISGTPSVIIAGVKSPSVTRISPTKLTAVVPLAAGPAGPVTVAVSSPQGGGISAAASFTLVAPTTLPTIARISPNLGHVSDDITLTGTGFGPPGTVGVSVGGAWARVTASTSTSVTFEVPSTDTTGLADITVGAATGVASKSRAFTVVPDAGITTVTPAAVTSYATGAADRITLDGSGFGTSGTVKVGSARAVAYTASAGGTHIAGVAVPTTTAGSVLITVTPTGSSTPLQTAVTVTAPAVTYVGPSPYARVYGPPDINQDDTGLVLDVATTGGVPMLVQGSGFGPTAGTVTVGATAARVLSWTDTAVTFTAPGHTVGSVAVTVTPAHATLSAGQNPGVTYVTTSAGPTVTRIASVVNQGRQRDEFDPVADRSNAFTLTGTALTGAATAVAVAATRVVLSDGSQTFTVVPTGVTATSLTFAAPRGFTNGGWKDVAVTTTAGTVNVNYGLYYLGAGVTLTVSPFSGLCLRTATAATASVTYTPAVVTIANSGSLFGTAGTVTIDGTSITPTSYAAGQVVLDLAHLPANLPNPWGGKAIVITPTAPTGLPTQTVGFTCAVTPSVTTTANGSPNDLTVPAGTSWTPGFTTSGFIAASGFTTPTPGGYEYVSAADYASTGFTRNVHAGIPTAAGDWSVRVALSRATYANADYLPFTPAPVHVTITGTPITLTPTSTHGASFTYKGQLGDGANGSSVDFAYSPSSTTDPVTAVTWEYRDSACESQGATAGWTDGLPKDVARSSTACGGDGTTVSKWDVRVKTFAMATTGVDRSIYYQATLPTVQVTITPRNVAVAGARADKVYDTTATATFGNLTFTGEIDGDDLTLSGASTGTFADPAAGVNKPVTLSGPLTLGGGSAGDYTLTNPNPTIVGTIGKAATVLTLAGSTASILLSPATTVTMTAAVTTASTGAAVDNTATTPVLSSQTPGVCTVSGTTVRGVSAGVCVIAGTDAGSTNYLPATAASDPTSHTATFPIQVFPAKQIIAVVADDLTAAAGTDIEPTSEVSGLFTGDSVDGVTYTYYAGHTVLPGAPTTPGTYRIVPAGGTLHAADPSVYADPSAFTYVAGTLTLTAVPPTITTITPASGTTAGGTRVTVTGTLLTTVRLLRIGGVTLRTGDFTVTPDGTELTFITPRAATAGVVDVVLVNGTATATYPFTYTTPVITAPGAPTHVAATGGNAKIDVTFTPPASTGGAPITAYQISTDGGRTWHLIVTTPGSHGSRTATIGGLRNGVTYPVQVRAVNTSGAGAASAPTHARPSVPAPVTAPSAPTRLTAVGGNASIAVTFVAPAATGGAPITAYQVSTDGGRTWHTVPTAAGPGGTRTTRITGVRNGVTYPVQVRAVNAAGAGAASAPVHARPTAPPVTAFNAPTGVTAVGHDQRIDVTFTPPTSTGGSPITHYQVSTDGGRTWHTVTTRAGAHGTRTAVVRRVENGVRYPVKVRAVTARRAGPASGMHPVIPNAPKLPTVKPRDPSEIPIPADPAAYTGPQRYTTARDTSHNGTWAHPISKLGHRQLTKGEAATLFKGSLFEFDSAVLTPDGVTAVANLAGHLRIAHAVSCEGYTDYAGAADHELTLSQQRAQAICTRLVHDGAHITFTTHGYGGARPVVVGGTPQSRDDNRRVVVIVNS